MILKLLKAKEKQYYLESSKRKTVCMYVYYIHIMNILQLMTEFPSETMKDRWNNIFKVLKGGKTVKAEFYIRQKYHSRIRAK